jgi:hypothetical protein
MQGCRMMLVKTNREADGFTCLCLPDFFRFTQEDIVQGAEVVMVNSNC